MFENADVIVHWSDYERIHSTLSMGCLRFDRIVVLVSNRQFAGAVVHLNVGRYPCRIYFAASESSPSM